MPNIAKYNREDVIHKAMLLFWQKGFRATSTRDLQQAVDMRPGSIYAAFGSKEDLYAEALKHYASCMSGILDEKLTQHSSGLAGLRSFFEQVLFESTLGEAGQVCMLIKTLSELTDVHAELRAQAIASLSMMEHLFTDIIRDAQVSGEISADDDPQRVARSLQVQLIGMRSYYQSTGDQDAVRQLLDDAFSRIRV
jgi:AcrR family transcriptional regulator